MNYLVDTFQPSHYELALEITANKNIFAGNVNINGIKKNKQDIRLNSHGLNIEFAKINGEKFNVSAEKNDEITLENSKEINGEINIELSFSGKLKYGDMSGLYPSRYEFNGETCELLSTQFESTGARRVFPCIDEPNAKATFDVEISVSGMSDKIEILSNMPEISRENIDGKIISKFAKTPKMSTYLLALVVGELQKVSRKTARGLEVNIFATPAQKSNSMDYAADWAVKLVDFYEEYFNIDFPLPKIDHVAIPDFSSGAMENWGLITYRESCLLVQPSDSNSEKQYVATVIAHELAHQWFGNLVTMKWWNDLWLNESFASFMENFSTHTLMPEWHVWSVYGSGNIPSALRRDSLSGVQSVRENINDPAEIDTLFDGAIVYTKGSRYLQMVHKLVGDKAWRKALKNYFTKYAYKNTEMNDLWDEIVAASDLNFDLSAMMNDLLTRPGYPIVSVEKLENGDIKLTQERFLQNEDSQEERPFTFPIFANDPNAPLIMNTKSVVFTPLNNADDFQLNIGNNSHFISLYHGEINEKLLSNLAQYPETDRLKIICEYTQISESNKNYLSAKHLVSILKSIENENKFSVWIAINILIRNLIKIIENDEKALSKLKEIVLTVTEKAFNEFKIRNDASAPSDNDKNVYSLLFSRRIWAGSRDQINEGLSIFAKNRHDISKINSELSSSVFANAIINGEKETFSFLLDQYKISSDVILKSKLEASLTAAKDQDQINILLELMKNQQIIRPQDLPSWFSSLLLNKKSRIATWNWMRENWSFLEDTYKDDQSFDFFARCTGAILSTEIQLKEFTEFFAPFRENPQLKRSISVGEKDIAGRIKWIANNHDDLIKELMN